LSGLIKILVLAIAVLSIGAGLVVWKTKYAKHNEGVFISKEEMEIFLETALNPMQLRVLAQNPEWKKDVVKNVSELFSVASQAKKEGFAEEPETKRIITGMKREILALNYDREKNADKVHLPPFATITEDQVNAFWTETPEEKSGLMFIWKGAEKRRYKKEFEIIYDEQIKFAKERGLLPKDDKELDEEQKKQTEEQREQMKTQFAKLMISYEEAREKLASIPGMTGEEKKKWGKLKKKTKLQIKFQEAQLLVQNYVQEKLLPKLKIRKEEIEKYLAEHPELTKEKKDKAEDILKRAKDGEDFATLAKTYSEDLGSRENGGLYEKVFLGQMLEEFEEAALKLEPGKVSKTLVETKFGYHIIKLERKNNVNGKDDSKEATYDVRHILISSGIKNPDNPLGNEEIPLKTFVNQKISKEKQKRMLREIKSKNPVKVAEDFEIKVPPDPSGTPLNEDFNHNEKHK